MTNVKQFKLKKVMTLYMNITIMKVIKYEEGNKYKEGNSSIDRHEQEKPE